MTEPTPQPRRPLATFLRTPPPPTPGIEPAQTVPLDDSGMRPEATDEATPDSESDIALHVDDTHDDSAAAADTGEAAFRHLATGTGAHPPVPTRAPSFMRAPAPAPPTPRWQWGLVAGLVVLLGLQIAVADRARLAADAGSRPWIAGLCSVLRCSLPAWQEPTAFSMISRDVRPVVGVAGALQVQASFRNDARWAQAWPSLRLSLSDADGRVIGTRVFGPRDYLDPAADAAAVLEPGQSAQIAFRVREPAASTVAFTFEFL